MIVQQRSGGGTSDPCVMTQPQYIDMLLSNAAELIGYFLGWYGCSLIELVDDTADMYLLDKLGRKRTTALMFGLCGVALVFLRFDLGPLTLTLCVVRAAALGFNQAIWVYSGEVFPTTHRVNGVGLTSSFSRIGSVGTMFLAYVVFAQSLNLALAVCVACCVAVCGCGESRCWSQVAGDCRCADDAKRDQPAGAARDVAGALWPIWLVIWTCAEAKRNAIDGRPGNVWLFGKIFSRFLPGSFFHSFLFDNPGARTAFRAAL